MQKRTDCRALRGLEPDSEILASASFIGASNDARQLMHATYVVRADR